MEKRIQNIIDLASAYDWQVDLTRDRQVNFRNENKDLLVVYWNSKNDLYTIMSKAKLSTGTEKRRNCDMDVVENVFKFNSLFHFVDTKKISSSITLDQLSETIIDTLRKYTQLEGGTVRDLPSISDEIEYEELKDVVKKLIFERRDGLLNEISNPQS